jgi:hypothetical protein
MDLVVTELNSILIENYKPILVNSEEGLEYILRNDKFDVQSCPPIYSSWG